MSKFSADIARYRAKGSGGKGLWLNPAVWAIASYRLGSWLHEAKPFFLIRVPLKIVSFVANKFCEVFMEMCIDPHASGKELRHRASGYDRDLRHGAAGSTFTWR